MLIIRYRIVGKKNHAQFKIVVAEKSFSVKGKFIEALGSYDPHNKEAVLKEDRIKHWLEIGAQCSDSVHNLLVSKGLIKGKKRKVNIPKPAESEEAGKAEDEKEAVVDENKKEDSVEENQPAEEKEEEKKEAPEEAEKSQPVDKEKNAEPTEVKKEEDKK